MKTISKTFTFFSVFFVIVIFGFLVLSIGNHAKESALRSCIYSATSDIAEHSKLVDTFAKGSNTWYILNDEEAKKVFAEVSFTDCTFSGSQPKDIAEKNLKIAVKKDDEHSFRIAVWSRGFDNVSGTSDDIYYPFDEKPLQ